MRAIFVFLSMSLPVGRPATAWEWWSPYNDGNRFAQKPIAKGLTDMNVSSTPEHAPMHARERALAVVAAAASLFLTLALWRSISLLQSMWPLPALYLLELGAAALVTAASFLRRLPVSSRIAWAATGTYIAFGIFALFSVGLVYLLMAVMFGLLAVVSTAEHHDSWLEGLGIFLLAAMGQGIIMGVVLRLLAGTG
jgi:hypothetical protein